MAVAAGAAVDVSTVFAVILAAYQQQQQRSMAAWNLIMTATMTIRSWTRRTISPRRRSKGAVSIYQRKDFKASGWWQELQDEDLSDHTSRAARRFRGDFRVPYCFFEELVALVKQRECEGASTIEFSFSFRASTWDMVRAKLCVACCPCLLTVC